VIAAVVSLLGGWRAVAFAAALLVALAWGGAEHLRLAGARAALATLQAEVAATSAAAAIAARTETDRRDAASSDATQSMLDYLGASLPAIETRTHDTIERIRTVYRDRPATACPDRPDGVRAELDAARARANGAASRGLPAPGSGAGAADPAAWASDGRMGARRDGDRRVGAVGVDSGAGLPRAAAVGARHPVVHA
jgi:hypothetical protein